MSSDKSSTESTEDIQTKMRFSRVCARQNILYESAYVNPMTQAERFELLLNEGKRKVLKRFQFSKHQWPILDRANLHKHECFHFQTLPEHHSILKVLKHPFHTLYSI